MQKQIEQYIENIKQDYVGWGNPKTGTEKTVRDNMVKEFCESISVKPGKKYIKVMTKIGTSNSVHSFIASKDFTTSKGVQFKQGDILKAASWALPALNAPRGNIFGEYVVKWTGACYMDGQKRLLV